MLFIITESMAPISRIVWRPLSQKKQRIQRSFLALIVGACTQLHLPVAKADASNPAAGDQITFYYSFLRDYANGVRPLPYTSSDPNNTVTVFQAILTNMNNTNSSNKINQVRLDLIPFWDKEASAPYQNLTQVAFQLYGFGSADVSYNKASGCSPYPGITDVDCSNTGISFGTSVEGGGGPQQTGNLNFIVDLPPPGDTPNRLNGFPKT